MSIYSPPPLPPRPITAIKSVFDLNGSRNSFPEAEAIPLQYEEPYTAPKQLPLPTSNQSPESQTNHASLRAQPSSSPFSYGNDYSQPTSQPVNAQEIYYQTPSQYGGSSSPTNAQGPLPHSFTKNSSTWKIVAAVAGALTILALLAIVGFAVLSFGTTGAVLSILLACVPFAMIFGCIVWIGRWDAEPWGLRIAAFLWGSAGSIILTLSITAVLSLIIGPARTDFQAVAIQAPIIEEFAKGIAVLAIALFLRKRFDGPVDGVVYMALVAAGFAFTENILYFGSAYSSGGIGGITSTFFLRAILSPFAHVIFSIPMGIVLGMARSRGLNRLPTIGLFFAAYPLSVFLHALWNGSSVLVGDTGDWLLFYLLVQFPIFSTAIGVAIWLRRAEAKLTYKRLTEYGWMGWFTPPEVDSFATWEGRKRIVAWASSKSPQAGTLMKEITKDVVDLTYNRERIVRNQGKSMLDDLLKTEQELLDKIALKKTFLLAL
jgi:RsiW-degrading membrane proteinase PrsW (M82 family)